MIVVTDVTVAFGGVRPLERLSVELDGSIVGVVGPNGAGKTTLLNVLSGFVKPISGSIIVDGTEILGMSPHRRARWGVRRTFQTEQVVDELTVDQNVMVMADTTTRSASERRSATDRALELTSLADLADRPAMELNAFQRRLVEIARAVVGSPRVVMLDEPAAGLSDHETGELRRSLAALPEATGAMLVLVDHDVELIAAVCENTAVLDFGRLIAYGPTRQCLDDPRVKEAYLGVDLTVDEGEADDDDRSVRVEGDDDGR